MEEALRALSRNARLLAWGEGWLCLISLFWCQTQLKHGLGWGVLILSLILACWCGRLLHATRHLNRALSDDATLALRMLVLELAAQAALSSVTVLIMLLLRGWTVILTGLLLLDIALAVLRGFRVPGLATCLQLLYYAVLARMTCFALAGLAMLALGPGFLLLTAFVLVILVLEARLLRRLRRFLGSVDPEELQQALKLLSTLAGLQGGLLVAATLVSALALGVLLSFESVRFTH